jgi:glycosyltransferase involved in cell wall biosynthesis
MKSGLESVTVLIPTYNAMPYLQDSVRSVLAQTHAEFELLIIDDGSTDCTYEYLSEIDDPRLRIIKKKNEGLVKTLNLGLEEASNPWIARLDADDVMRRDRLEKQISFLQHWDFSLVGCNYGFIDKYGKVFRIKKKYDLANPPEFNPLLDHNIPHQSVLYKKDLVVSLGGYRDLVPAEDLDLWLRMSEHSKLAMLPDELVFIRILDSGISLKHFIKQRIMWRYVKYCARRRRSGQPEESFDEWFHVNEQLIKQKQRRWRSEKAFRMAGFHLVCGKPLMAALCCAQAFIIHPVEFCNKLSTYNLGVLGRK